MTWTNLRQKPKSEKKEVWAGSSGHWVDVWKNGDVFYGIDYQPQGRFDGTADEAKAYIEERLKTAK